MTSSFQEGFLRDDITGALSVSPLDTDFLTTSAADLEVPYALDGGLVFKTALEYDIRDYGAIGDGSVHALSARYGTLAAAQVAYPFATALTQQIDWCAITKAVKAANTAGGGSVRVPRGIFLIDAPIVLYSGVHLWGVSGNFKDDTKGSVIKTSSAGALAGAAMVDVNDTRYAGVHRLALHAAGTTPFDNTTDGITDFSDVTKQAGFLVIEDNFFYNIGGTRIGLYGNVNIIERNAARQSAGHFIWIRNSITGPGVGTDYPVIAGNDSGDCYGNSSDHRPSARASITSGSPTLTVLTSYTNTFQANQLLYGFGIPAGTTISTVVGSTITMSANATQTRVISVSADDVGTTAIGSPNVTSTTAGFAAYMVGRSIAGVGIPANTRIGSYSAGTVGLVDAAGAAVNATANGTVAIMTVARGDGIRVDDGGFSGIYDNVLYNHRYGIALDVVQPGYGTYTCRVTSNRCEKHDIAGFYFNGGGGHTVTGNHAFNCGTNTSSGTRAGYRVTSNVLKRITFTGNYAEDVTTGGGSAAMQIGFDIAGTKTASITGCTVDGAQTIGLFLTGSRNAVTGLTVQNCGLDAVRLSGASNNDLTALSLMSSGQVTDGTYAGVNLLSASTFNRIQATVRHESATIQAKYGIVLSNDSIHNNLTGSNLTSSGRTGPLSPGTGVDNNTRNITGVSAVYEDNWVPAGALAETFRRSNARIDPITIVSGLLQVGGGMTIPAGRPVANITFVSGSQAAVAPTHWWFVLLDQSRNVLGITADQTSTAWAANTPKTLALTSAYTPSADMPVYVAVCVVAGTVPTIAGTASAVASAASNIAPIIAGTSSGALTDPASLASPAGALTVGHNLYSYVT